MASFEQRLRELRERNSETQKQIATLVGKGESAVRMWELGRSAPGHDVLKLLAKHFDVSIDYLLGLINTPHPNFFDDNGETITLARKMEPLGSTEKKHLDKLIDSMLEAAREAQQEKANEDS